MQRRVVIAGLAGLLAGAAQDGANAAPRETEAASPGRAELLYLQQARAVGARALALSRLAARRGDDDDVKEFVQFEIAEHEALADVFRAVESPGSIPGHVDPPSDGELLALLDGRGKDALQRLAAQKTGPAFDQDYIRLQIDGHKQLFDIHTDYLAAGHDLLSLTIAKLARAMVSEHLVLLGDIDAALGRG